MMEAVWRFITDNQQVLSWLGGGAVVVAGGIWTVTKFFLKRDKPKPVSAVGGVAAGGNIKGQSHHDHLHGEKGRWIRGVILRWAIRIWRRAAPVPVSANAGVAAGGSIIDSPITIHQTDNTEVLKETRAVKALVEQLIARAPAHEAPGTEMRVGEAIGEIARGASEGDPRLQTALDLLRENKVADAARILQAVAADKTARIKQDTKDAATAYRNLGAIAGLRDPKQALDAYSKVVELDPDDVGSLFWVGWLEMDRGLLGAAEQRFRGVLAAAAGEGEAWNRHWATLGLGDIQFHRGDLAGALTSYQASLAIADRLAQADPGNAGWQRDLSVSQEKIGDVRQAQGDLAGALTSYQASLAIRDRLAQADPGNGGWQRDLATSHERIGAVRSGLGDAAEAIASFERALGVYQELRARNPSDAISNVFSVVPLWWLGRLKGAEGRGDLKGALAILEKLAAADRLDARRRGWIGAIRSELAALGD